MFNRRKHQGVDSSSYILKKSKTGHITCRNESAIRRFAGDSPDNKAGSTAGNQTSGDESAMNAVTTSHSYTGIPSIHKNYSIHTSKLSSIGRPVTEQEAQEIEKEPTAESASVANSKMTLRFLKSVKLSLWKRRRTR